MSRTASRPISISPSNVINFCIFVPRIPVIIHKFKIDPAVASGPFITTINDALGLIIYFSIATQLLHLL
uniref:magnesium transporter n=1 Tax=Jeotgalibaca porci TaxID=1868793 RepID=UPI0035A13719